MVGRVWNWFRRMDLEPLDCNHQEPPFNPWNPWSNCRIAPKLPLPNSVCVGQWVGERMRGESISHGLNREIPVEIRNFRVSLNPTDLAWFWVYLPEINVSSNFLDIHNIFGTLLVMEISPNFGGEYFYPLNPELPGYKLGTSGFTVVPG